MRHNFKALGEKIIFNRQIIRWWPILLFITVFLIAYRNLWNLGEVAYGDCPAFPISFETAYHNFASVWVSDSWGNTVPRLPSVLIQGLFVSISQGSIAVAQKIYMLLPLPLCFIAMYIFLGRYISSRVARWVGAFIYAVNPHTLGSGFLGGSFGTIYAHGLYPLIIIFSLGIFKKDSPPLERINNALLFTLSLAVAFSFSQAIIIFIFPILVFLWIRLLFAKGLKLFIVSSILLFLSGAVFVLLLAPWFSGAISTILPYLSPKLASTSSFTAETAGQSQQLEVVRACYGSQPIINLLTLQWKSISSWSGWGLLIPLLAFFSLLINKGRKKNAETVLRFSAGAMLVILFMVLTHFHLIDWLFVHLPFLFSFHNTAKISLLLSFFYAILIAFTLESAERRIASVKNWPTKRLFLGLFMIVILMLGIFNRQFFYGGMDLLKNRGKGMFIPSSFYEIKSYLDDQRQQEGPFKTLWLPWTYEEAEVKLRWIEPETLNFPLGLEQFAFSTSKDYVLTVLKHACDENSKNFGALLTYANVRYVIVNLKSALTDPAQVQGIYVVGEPGSFAGILNSKKDIRLVINNPDYLIYENKEKSAVISAAEKIVVVNKTDLNNYDFDYAFHPVVIKEFLSSDAQKEIPGDMVASFSVNNADNFGIFSSLSSDKQVNFTKISEAEYLVILKTRRPVFIIFKQAYHPGWNAYCGKDRLIHIPSFYGNLFLLKDTGNKEVRIIFEGQKNKKMVTKVAIFSWIALLAIIIFNSLMIIVFRLVKGKKENGVKA